MLVLVISLTLKRFSEYEHSQQASDNQLIYECQGKRKARGRLNTARRSKNGRRKYRAGIRTINTRQFYEVAGRGRLSTSAVRDRVQPGTVGGVRRGSRSGIGFGQAPSRLQGV